MAGVMAAACSPLSPGPQLGKTWRKVSVNLHVATAALCTSHGWKGRLTTSCGAEKAPARQPPAAQASGRCSPGGVKVLSTKHAGKQCR